MFHEQLARVLYVLRIEFVCSVRTLCEELYFLLNYCTGANLVGELVTHIYSNMA